MTALEKYNKIMQDYRGGKFGSENLCMSDILNCANEPDLFDQMNAQELETLKNNATGFAKSMWLLHKSKGCDTI